MIKTLLDADENPPPEKRVIIEETIVEPPRAEPETVSSFERTGSAENNFEISSSANDVNTNDAARNAATIGGVNFQPIGEASKLKAESVVSTASGETRQPKSEQTLYQTEYQTEYKPESTVETMRKSGLAYAAAITLFGAVVFMMILGWGADLLLGTSPWGIVGGIILGAIIGFVQFFRLTSQIINNKD